MKKFICNDCDSNCSVSTPDNANTPCYCLYEKECAEWHEVEEAVTNCNQLPKLTTDVFNHPYCPEWARYATVDKDGKARFHAEEPTIPTSYDAECWCSASNDIFVTGQFDAYDWKNSLIKRPTKTKLPSWCKVGAIGYFDNSYFRIEHIDDNNDVTVMFFGYKGDGQCATLADYMMADKEKITQARPRPFTDKEMQGLIGKVFTTVNGDVSIATDFDHIMKSVYICSEWFTNKELADSIWQLNGKPCYKLEHLNDRGEWVK